MAEMKSNLLYFSSDSRRNCCHLVFKAGRSSNGRTLPSEGSYLGSNPSLPALQIKSTTGPLKQFNLVRIQVWQQKGMAFLLPEANKLLYLRLGREQRNHIFSPEKIDELVPRQNFLTKKF